MRQEKRTWIEIPNSPLVVESSDQLSNFLRGFSQIVEFIKANEFVNQRLKNGVNGSKIVG